MQKHIWYIVCTLVVIAVFWALYSFRDEKSTFYIRPNAADKPSFGHSGLSHSIMPDGLVRSSTLITKPQSINTHSARKNLPFQQNSGFSDSYNRHSGYIITQTYGGQMTRAIRNMMLQQCWGGTLSTNQSVFIVEPFSAQSNLIHSSKFWNAVEQNRTTEAPSFSDYYDLEYYNRYSESNKSIALALWSNFLANAPRESVVIVTPQTACQSFPHGDVQTLSSNCSMPKPFQQFLTGLQKWKFTISKTICIECNALHRPLTIEELYGEIYRGRNVSMTTVLISSWRNYAFTSSWLQLPSYCRMGEDATSSKRLIPSKSIVRNTEYYKRKILRSDRVVAVMLRIERFLTLKATGRSKESVESCINKTLELWRKLRVENVGLSNSGTFLTLDIGRFGSKIMQDVSTVKKFGQESLQSINNTVFRTIQVLYNGKYSQQTWENTFVKAAGGITERGYIAMLQRNIATESDCLILMGGGSFQQVAAFQYIKNHPDPTTRCVHTVCVADSFTKSIGL